MWQTFTGGAYRKEEHHEKSLLLKSGFGLLVLGCINANAFSATQIDGGMYDGLRAFHGAPQLTIAAERGAEGPIRSVDVQPAAVDIYQSLSKYQAAQDWGTGPSERGAQGPVRSEADMAMERDRLEWKQMVGIFVGTD